MRLVVSKAIFPNLAIQHKKHRIFLIIQITVWHKELAIASKKPL